MNITEQPRGRLGAEWLSVFLTLVTLVSTLGGWVWWGGRLAQHVDMLDASVTRMQTYTLESSKSNARQDSAIAVSDARWAEVLSRLNRIEAKQDAAVRR